MPTKGLRQTTKNYKVAPLMIVESRGFIIPVFGLTKYFFGEVVFTWQINEGNIQVSND